MDEKCSEDKADGISDEDEGDKSIVDVVILLYVWQ